MADGAHKSLTRFSSNASDGLVAGLKSFAAGHGGATAVIEYAGRRGARILLIGHDGTLSSRCGRATICGARWGAGF
jgi:hypothetical protein